MAAAVVAGCAPALDWREVRVEGTELVALFPCKPVAQAKQLVLAGTGVQLTLLACGAGQSTWALAHADMVDPSRVGPALAELLSTTTAKLSSSPPESLPLHVDGATPNPNSKRVEIAGQQGDGRPLTTQVAVFARGTRVFQATWLGNDDNRLRRAEAADTFFAGFRISR